MVVVAFYYYLFIYLKKKKNKPLLIISSLLQFLNKKSRINTFFSINWSVFKIKFFLVSTQMIISQKMLLWTFGFRQICGFQPIVLTIFMAAHLASSFSITWKYVQYDF